MPRRLYLPQELWDDISNYLPLISARNLENYFPIKSNLNKRQKKQAALWSALFKDDSWLTYVWDEHEIGFVVFGSRLHHFWAENLNIKSERYYMVLLTGNIFGWGFQEKHVKQNFELQKSFYKSLQKHIVNSKGEIEFQEIPITLNVQHIFNQTGGISYAGGLYSFSGRIEDIFDTNKQLTRYSWWGRDCRLRILKNPVSSDPETWALKLRIPPDFPGARDGFRNIKFPLPLIISKKPKNELPYHFCHI
jgi:hypothetical protein